MICFFKKRLKKIETDGLFINWMSLIKSVLYIIQLQYGLLSIDITIHLSFNLIPSVYNRPSLNVGFNNPAVRALLVYLLYDQTFIRHYRDSTTKAS